MAAEYWTRPKTNYFVVAALDPREIDPGGEGEIIFSLGGGYIHIYILFLFY